MYKRHCNLHMYVLQIYSMYTYKVYSSKRRVYKVYLTTTQERVDVVGVFENET